MATEGEAEVVVAVVALLVEVVTGHTGHTEFFDEKHRCLSGVHLR